MNDLIEKVKKLIAELEAVADEKQPARVTLGMSYAGWKVVQKAVQITIDHYNEAFTDVEIKFLAEFVEEKEKG